MQRLNAEKGRLSSHIRLCAAKVDDLITHFPEVNNNTQVQNNFGVSSELVFRF